MADFCKQCSIDNFGEDFGDLAGLVAEGWYTTVICEGCGETVVDHTGKCVCHQCLEKHGDPPATI